MLKFKKLELSNPPIKVFLNHAYILSVLLNDTKSLPWFYSNYIQIYFFKKIDGNLNLNFYIGNMTKYFYNIPFLEVRTLDKRFFIKEIINYIDFFVDSIEHGYYIMTIVDEFYIKGKREFSKDHFMHLIMLHGYDRSEKSFYASGIFDNNIYGEQKISFNEFNQSFISESGYNKGIRDYSVMLFKHREAENLPYPLNNYNYFDYSFDVKNVKLFLNEYLYSMNSEEKLRMYYNLNENIGFGMEVYDNIISNIKLKIKQDIKSEIDYRGYHGLMEHKEIMVKRIDYMVRNNYLYKSEDLLILFKNIENRTHVLRNIILKYNVSLKDTILIKAIDLVKQISEDEKIAIKKVLDRL